MIKYEIRKLFKNRFLPLLMLIFVCADVWKIYSVWENKYYVGRDYNSAKQEIYNSVQGNWENKKIEFVVNTYQNAMEIVQSGNYSTDPNQDGTYTGYIFGDWGLFGELKDKMENQYKYNEYSNSIVQKANENIVFYKNLNNNYRTLYYEKINSSYSNRSIDSFYDIDGFLEMINYPFSSLLIMGILLCFLSPLFARERAIGMCGLLRTTERGGMSYVKSKLVTAVIFAIVITLLMTVTDIVTFTIIYDIKGLFQPIYSIIPNTPFNCTIGGYLCFMTLFRIIGAVHLALIISTISACLSNEMWVFGIGTLITAGMIIITQVDNLLMRLINPIYAFTITDTASEFDAVSLFNKPVFEHNIMIISQLICIIAWSFIAILCEKKGLRRFSN